MRLAAIAWLLGFLATSARADHCTAFRGADGSGVSAADGRPLEWSAAHLWRLDTTPAPE